MKTMKEFCRKWAKRIATKQMALIAGNGRFLLALGVVANHHHGQEDTGYLAEPACTSEHEECPSNQSDYA